MNQHIFKQLYEEYFDTIRSYIFYRIKDEDFATDLAQDIFMQIWIKRSQWKGQKSSDLLPLLYKMAKDMIISHYRKQNVHEDFTQYMHLNSDSIEKTMTPEELLLYEETKEKYNKVLNLMNDSQRVAFLMSREENLKYAEIAQRLNISQKAVEKRISIALDFLRKSLIIGFFLIWTFLNF